MRWQITLSDDSIKFELGAESHELPYSDICRVALSTVDLITMDEIVLTLYKKDGTGWEIPESLEGASNFFDVLTKLELILPDFQAYQIFELANKNPFSLRDETVWNRVSN